jgi:peptidoglycan lytic transglycosylase
LRTSSQFKTNGRLNISEPSDLIDLFRVSLLVFLASGFLWLAASPRASAQNKVEVKIETEALETSALGYSSVLAVLSDEDVVRYEKIFTLQERGDMKSAKSLVGQLDNDILLGHVLFQRYMHPTAYRSSYKELSTWLTAYADHPGAKRVYRLAKMRKPSGAKAPVRAERRRWRALPTDPGLRSKPPRRKNTSKRRRVAQIKTHVRSLLRRERPTQALNYVNEKRVQRDLTDHEYGQIRQWIANSYYLENVDSKSLRLSKSIIKKNGKKVPLAYWTAGLSSWRMGEKEEAANYFTHVARAEYVSSHHRSAGAYWAARAYLVTREPKRVIEMLEIAADQNTSFYGILAARQLGIEPGLGEASLTVTRDEIKSALEIKGVARAVALAQIGEVALGEEEMRRAHAKCDATHDPALLVLTQHWHLPSSQLEIADYSDVPALNAGLYPIPEFAPDDGFKLDRALLFAFMRQESKFNSRATSRVGARGLMQLMPRTAVHVAKDRSLRSTNKDRLYEPSFNMMLGQMYIQELMSSYGLNSNLFELLVAYNGGPGNLRKWKRNTVFQDDPLLFIESIPSRETRGFLKAVSRNLWMYRLTLNQEVPSLDLVASGNWPKYLPIETSFLAPKSKTPAIKISVSVEEPSGRVLGRNDLGESDRFFESAPRK